MTLTELVRLKLDMARRFRKSGNFQAAENELNEALAVYPDHTVLLEALGELFLAAGRVSDAARLSEDLYLKHTGSAGPIKLRGEVLLKQGRAEEALEMFLEAERQSPSPYVKGLIVRALTRLNRYEEAIDAGEAAASQFPEATFVLSNLENAYAQAGKREEAARVCEKLLKLRPQDPLATRDLLKNHLAALPPKEASSELEALLRVPSYQGNAAIQKLAGEHYYKAGDFERATAAYKAALALGPSDRYALEQLGFCLYRMDKFLEAIGILEPFFLDDPLNVFVRSALVTCYKKLGMASELAQTFDRALAAHPDARQLHGIRKKALKSLGIG